MFQVILSAILLFLPRLAIAAVVFVAFWLAGDAARGIVQRVMVRRKVDGSLINLLAGTARGSLVLLGGISAMGTLGIDVTAMVAGLGLTGFALGFALKDIIANALSGILLIIYKPFKENDVIAVTTFEGRVREINLRFTTLASAERMIYIPNAMVINNAVVVANGPASGSGTILRPGEIPSAPPPPPSGTIPLEG
ncbi:MAG: mechanosensitive ion channel domain-containing protein [Thermoguttaceae bacterium]|jgi:small-conductance mechanosensitive channel